MRQRLIELRGNKSRTIVAKELGITPQMLGYIERGTRNPSLKLIRKLSDYYGITIDDVIFFIDNGNEMYPM